MAKESMTDDEMKVILEAINTEGGIEKVLKELLVDQYGLDKTQAGTLVSCGFDKESALKCMEDMKMADKLKGDYLKLLNLWKQDVVARSNSDLEFLMKESELSFDLIEAGSGSNTWKVCVIEGGKSYNKTVYTDKALTDIVNIINEAAKKGEPIKCNAFKFEDVHNHLPETARTFIKGFVQNIAGWFKNASRVGNQVIAELHLDEGMDKVKSLLTTAIKNGIKKPFGLSIDGKGNKQKGHDGVEPVWNVMAVESLASIDMVTYPSAGGKFIELVESINKDNDEIKCLIESIGNVFPDITKDIKPENLNFTTAKEVLAKAEKNDVRFKFDLSESNVAEAITKVIETNTVITKEKGDRIMADEKKEQELQAKMQESMTALTKQLEETKRATCAMLLTRVLSESGLPKQFKDIIADEFKDKVFEEKELRDRMTVLEKAVGDYKTVEGTNRGASVTVIADSRDKAMDACQKAIDIVLLGKTDESGKAREGADLFKGSIRNAYTQLTGDEDVSGEVGKRDKSRISEAIASGDFPYLLANSATKALIREYEAGDMLYRKVCRVVQLKDFKTQDRIAFGEFANISTVSEAAAFTEFSTPGEERVQYTPTKRGNYIGISRESILNDDLRKFASLTKKIGRAALRTLNQFVFDKLINYSGSINGGTIYDSKALYAGDHGNIMSDALSFTSLDKAIVKMWNQKDLDAKLELGIEPKYLIIPRALKATAERVVNSTLIPGEGSTTSMNDINPVYHSVEILVSPYLRSDANNWYLEADPMVWDGLELGFVQGKETPTLVMQTAETDDSMFSNDQLRYKVRHEYGAVQLDYRPFVGSFA